MNFSADYFLKLSIPDVSMDVLDFNIHFNNINFADVSIPSPEIMFDSYG